MDNTRFEQQHPRQPDGRFAPKNRAFSSGVSLTCPMSSVFPLPGGVCSSSIEYMTRLDMVAQEWLNNADSEQDDYPYLRDYLVAMSEGEPACDDDVIALADDLDFQETKEGNDIACEANARAQQALYRLATSIEDSCGNTKNIIHDFPAINRDFLDKATSDYHQWVYERGDSVFAWASSYEPSFPALRHGYAYDLYMLHMISPDKNRDLLGRARQETVRQAVSCVCDHYQQSCVRLRPGEEFYA